MLEKFNQNKKAIIGNFSAVLIGFIGSAILATFLGEKLGYASSLLYVYGLFGHKKVSVLMGKLVK